MTLQVSWSTLQGRDSFSGIGRDEHTTIIRAFSELWKPCHEAQLYFDMWKYSSLHVPFLRWWKIYFALGRFCQSKPSNFTPQPAQSRDALPSEGSSCSSDQLWPHAAAARLPECDAEGQTDRVTHLTVKTMLLFLWEIPMMQLARPCF